MLLNFWILYGNVCIESTLVTDTKMIFLIHVHVQMA